MASITSVISLFVLLAVSCYSLPVEKSFATSTFGNEVNTDVTNSVSESAVNMHLISEDESTSLPILQKIRTLFEHGIDEVTVSVPEESRENVTFAPRSADTLEENITHASRSMEEDITHDQRSIDQGITVASRSMEEDITHDQRSMEENITHAPRSISQVITVGLRSVDEPITVASYPVEEPVTVASRSISQVITVGSRSVDEPITVASETGADEMFPTVESGPVFERRAIRPENTQLVKESAVVVLNGTELESATVVEPSEVTSAFTNFAQTTGLLQGTDPEVITRFEELLTTEFPVESERLIKTVAIIPGQITETKIYPNVPSKTVVATDRVQPLSQGQKQPVVEKKESNH